MEIIIISFLVYAVARWQLRRLRRVDYNAMLRRCGAWLSEDARVQYVRSHRGRPFPGEQGKGYYVVVDRGIGEANLLFAQPDARLPYPPRFLKARGKSLRARLFDEVLNSISDSQWPEVAIGQLPEELEDQLFRMYAGASASEYKAARDHLIALAKVRQGG